MVQWASCKDFEFDLGAGIDEDVVKDAWLDEM